jgi:hypothetical protein
MHSARGTRRGRSARAEPRAVWPASPEMGVCRRDCECPRRSRPSCRRRVCASAARIRLGRRVTQTRVHFSLADRHLRPQPSAEQAQLAEQAAGVSISSARHLPLHRAPRGVCALPALRERRHRALRCAKQLCVCTVRQQRSPTRLRPRDAAGALARLRATYCWRRAAPCAPLRAPADARGRR